MDQMVKLVYRGPGPAIQHPGLGLLFVKGDPVECTKKQADTVMSNNPTPAQLREHKYYDVFEIVGAPAATHVDVPGEEE